MFTGNVDETITVQRVASWEKRYYLKKKEGNVEQKHPFNGHAILGLGKSGLENEYSRNI